jgi:hypothetical protein
VPKPPKAFDVWFVAANTVYKGVPYNVVADWTQQGRLAAADRVRPTGSTGAWVTVAEHELLSDYLPRPAAARAAPAPRPAAVAEGAGAAVAVAEAPAAGEAAELPEPVALSFGRRGDDEDDVDMIPLIDISMVLLVFFIMIRATGALSPVDVPEMRYAGQLSNDPDAITINIEKIVDPTQPRPEDREKISYSVRRGQEPPKPSHDLLPTPEAAVKALDELLAGVQRPPEVRIACRKDLPRERVYELRRELEDRKRKHYINSFAATVIEAPQQK